MIYLYIAAASAYLLVNSYAFGLMYVDKKRAGTELRRIAEKRLLRTAALGGSLGVYLAMRMFRHKTQKQSFRRPFFALIFLQITLVSIALYLFFIP